MVLRLIEVALHQTKQVHTYVFQHCTFSKLQYLQTLDPKISRRFAASSDVLKYLNFSRLFTIFLGFLVDEGNGFLFNLNLW